MPQNEDKMTKGDEQKYTPGPWWVCGDMPDEQKLLNPTVRAMRDGTTRTIVCRTGQYNHRPEEWNNARLIAAAPDLLEALKEFRYACTDKAEEMADAAIKKATGGV